MTLTLILSVVFILAIFLVLWTAVALVQDKRLFSSAPDDIVAAIRPREERFKGARFLGWTLVILSMLIIAAVFVVAAWDGVRRGYGFWQLFGRFLAILYIFKAADMILLDWVLLQKTHFFSALLPGDGGLQGLSLLRVQLEGPVDEDHPLSVPLRIPGVVVHVFA